MALLSGSASVLAPTLSETGDCFQIAVRNWVLRLLGVLLGRVGNDYGGSLLHTLGAEYVKLSGQRVLEAMAQEMGLPSTIALAADRFAQIPEVVDLRIGRANREAVFHVFVIMPTYNDELMDRLIDVEIAAEQEAEKSGYSLDVRYYPYPIITPASVGVESLPQYTKAI